MSLAANSETLESEGIRIELSGSFKEIASKYAFPDTLNSKVSASNIGRFLMDMERQKFDSLMLELCKLERPLSVAMQLRQITIERMVSDKRKSANLSSDVKSGVKLELPKTRAESISLALMILNQQKNPLNTQ